MRNVRLIARLDVKAPNLIKGVHLEGLRTLGDPGEFARRYYAGGADELLYIDIVASLYQRNSLADLVRKTAEFVFVPLTVGGGVRTIADVESLLRCGADKVAINTAAAHNPALISEVAQRFGAQCMVLSIEAKRRPGGVWEAYTDNGREPTGLDVVTWARRAAELGAGEILLTSVDQEGTRRGFDVPLYKAVCEAVQIPIIASGGLGTAQHLIDVVRGGNVDAVAVADALHYNRHSIADLRAIARASGISMRSAA